MGKFRASSWPIRLARVSGRSMAPTFRDGDLLVVRWFESVPADLPLLTVVLIEREVMPGVIFIKRI